MRGEWRGREVGVIHKRDMGEEVGASGKMKLKEESEGLGKTFEW